MTNAKTPEFIRTPNFESSYANNVRLESSVWDLKLIFGQLDQSLPGKEIINQRISISMPWLQAKLLSHILQVFVAAQELETGKIHVPMALVPPQIEPTPETENNPVAVDVRELANKMRDDFIANL